MSFHLGKPILMLLAITAITGITILLRSRPVHRGDLTLWVFADGHAKTYRGELADEFRRQTGRGVDIVLLTSRAENVRLEASFMANAPPETLPDLVEIEIGQVGKFFRPPPDEIGLLPLNDYLDKSPWKDQVVKARFAPWTKQGKIYGIPHDVHPVTLSYRYDLFAQAGIDLEKPRTWPDFAAACRAFQDYAKSHGHPERHAIELAATSSGDLEIMLLQQHVNLIDDYNRIHINDAKVAATLAFYAQLVAGPDAIAAHSSGEGGQTQDFNQGILCALLTPDWRITGLEHHATQLNGKMRMRALPTFAAGDSPTSTWGGTMLGILKSCPQKDRAWELAQFLYFSRDGMKARQRETDILPPVRSIWSDEIYQRPDPYFGGQKVDALYVELADQIPEHYVTPASPMASAILCVVLINACSYVDAHGSDGLQTACQKWLDQAAAELQRRIDHARFDAPPRPDADASPPTMPDRSR